MNTVGGELALRFKETVLGLYFYDRNHEDKKSTERAPSLPRLKRAVEFYGTSIMNAEMKEFCDDFLTRKKTSLV